MVTIGKFKLHYAWVVLFAACMLNIASRADHGSFGVFVEPLVELFGWSRGDISAAYSIAFIVGLPAVVIMGWLGDRYGARPLMIGAALLITAGTYLLGTITELWQFYAYDVLVLRGIHAAAERIGHFPEFGFIADVCAVGFSNWSSSSPPLFCPLFLLCRPRSNPSQPRPGRNYPFLHDYKNGAKYAVGDSLTGEHHPHSALPYQGGWNMIVVRVARSGRKNQ